MSIAIGMDCNFVTLNMSRVKRLITIDKEIVSGEPVFKGTRTPVYTLFEFLFHGETLEEYLVNFPSVSKKQAQEAIAVARKFLTSRKLASLYENLTGRKHYQKTKSKSARSQRVQR
jgi:uncharacterized protein (DUF433 family)